ncbi:HERV-H LTR-associating protein 1 [Varanus komodoensis]|nr:HERV-H LTR-associating protein 1 [Varanus komodoensis]
MKEQVAVLATAEVPVKSVDLAAFNLTELVNGMLNTVLKGTKKFFSVLSITSYSSYAFHKVSIVLYNISNLKNVDPSKFPMRYCYCLNNRTNDLTDFTTLLVDIVGNSTDYLTEIFKSTSIVSVSQSNDTDCIYICVMSGRIGRNLSDLWEAIEKSPVINYTFSGNVSDLLATRTPAWTTTGTSEGRDMLVTQHPLFLKTVSEVSSAQLSLWMQTSTLKGYGALSTKRTSAWPLPVEGYDERLPGALVPLTPRKPIQVRTIAVKGDETASPQFTMWRKTAALKGFDVSSSQMSSWPKTKIPKEQEVPSSPSPLMSDDLPSGTQPGPSVVLRELDNTTDVILLCRRSGEPNNTSFRKSTFVCNSYTFTKARNLIKGCPQGVKKGSPLITLSSPIQTLKPCVMELCKFYQQCFCTRDRRYSREKPARYCMENYSWFLKNATYICEKVQRTAYSKTLKQKCLAMICKSI